MDNKDKKIKLKGYYDSVGFDRSSKSSMEWNRSRSNKKIAMTHFQEGLANEFK